LSYRRSMRSESTPPPGICQLPSAAPPEENKPRLFLSPKITRTHPPRESRKRKSFLQKDVTLRPKKSRMIPINRVTHRHVSGTYMRTPTENTMLTE